MRLLSSTQEGVSLSFLDILACAFGAIVLLVLILPIGEIPIIAPATASPTSLANTIIEAQKLRDEIEALDDQLTANLLEIAQFTSSRSASEDRAAHYLQTIANLQREESSLADQRVKAGERIADLQGEIGAVPDPLSVASSYGGIPVDSEYVAFVIDTSGSMKSIWGRVRRQVSEVISLYPDLKGIQVLSDQGNYMSQIGTWLPDNPTTRRMILSGLRVWTSESNSNPGPGIEQAINDLYRPGIKMAVFVFGDDWNDHTRYPMLYVVDRIVKAKQIKEDELRIHGVAFPNRVARAPNSALLAIQLRELATRYNGAFVALEL